MGLPEPLRTTVLLRYFEERSSSEIARRMGVPAGTVRWRLKKAIERLRADLDQRFAGNRRTWAIALAPFGVLDPPLFDPERRSAIGKSQDQIGAAIVAVLVALILGGSATLIRQTVKGRTPDHSISEVSAGHGASASRRTRTVALHVSPANVTSNDAAVGTAEAGDGRARSAGELAAYWIGCAARWEVQQ